MRQRTLHIVLLAAIFCCCITAYGQDIIPTAHLGTSQNRLLVGDQARVVLMAQHDPATSSIAWPQVPDSFGKLEVVEKGRIDTVKQGRMLIYKQQLLVTGFDSGLFTIPPFHLQVTPKSGSPYTIQTGLLSLLVQTVPVDTTKPIKPIKDILPVEADKPITGIKIIDKVLREHTGLVIVGLLLLLGAIAFFIYMRRKKRPPLPPPPPEPLHIKTLRLLAELEKQGIWQKGEVKEYYVRLTDILRNYIEARFGLPAMERTTDELTAATRRHKELAAHTKQLYTILSTADMAKFARAQPLPDEHVSAMQLTKDFITDTIPAPTPATPEQS